jgi:hypothetical protein
MTIFLPALALAFAAFCVWLTVRIFNRRERWAKWTAVAVPVVLVILYPTAYLLLMEPIWTAPYFGGDRERYPHYRISIDNETAQQIFGVAHRIDRNIRPKFWNERIPYRDSRQP